MLNIQHAAQSFVRLGVPNYYIFVDGHGDQVAMSFVEGDTFDAGCMACQRCDAPSRVGVPKLDLSILSRRCHVLIR